MSQVLEDFRESVEEEEWPHALFGLNSLDMKEMLLGLASIPDSLLDEKGPLFNQPNEFQRYSPNMERILYAADVVQNMALPPNAPGDLSQTLQVQDAADFIRKYDKQIAWGAKVPREFKWKVIDICLRLGMDPSHLMACMHSESGLDPARKNETKKWGLAAVGLLQFTQSTAEKLHTSLTALAEMSAVDQLDYVEQYFTPYRHRLKNIDDVYCAMFNVFGIGQPPDFVLYSREGITLGGNFYGPKYYSQNENLDADGDGNITKAELSKRGRGDLVQGMANAG
jgi:hypothetical protein